MVKYRDSTKYSLESRLGRRASTRWPQLASIAVRHRANFTYVDAIPPDGTTLRLCRLRYVGSARDWHFAIYRPATRTTKSRSSPRDYRSAPAKTPSTLPAASIWTTHRLPAPTPVTASATAPSRAVNSRASASGLVLQATLQADTTGWGRDPPPQVSGALCDFAGDSRHASPWAADLYDQARARGYDHPHAGPCPGLGLGTHHLVRARRRRLRPRAYSALQTLLDQDRHRAA